MDDPGEQRHRGDLGGRGEEGGHRGGRAFVDVRRPHVERRGRDLEGEARDDEHQPEQQTQRDMAVGRRLDDAGEVRGAGEAIGQRGAIEQQARAERAQHEILQAGLGRLHAVPAQRRDDIERQRLQLQPHVERHQVGGRDHHHHAYHRQGDQQRVFEAQQVAAGHVALAHQQHRGGRQQDRHLGEAGEAVIDIEASEGLARAGGRQADPDRGHHEDRGGDPDQKRRGIVLGGVGRHQQRQHRIAAQQDLGQDDREFGGGHVGALNAGPRPGWPEPAPAARSGSSSGVPRPTARSGR